MSAMSVPLLVGAVVTLLHGWRRVSSTLPGMAAEAGADRAMRVRLIQAARALVEAGGPDALSMRKVAADVGVAATAIYWHVGSRDDLLHAVLDAMIDLPAPVARGRNP